MIWGDRSRARRWQGRTRIVRGHVGWNSSTRGTSRAARGRQSSYRKQFHAVNCQRDVRILLLFQAIHRQSTKISFLVYLFDYLVGFWIFFLASKLLSTCFYWFLIFSKMFISSFIFFISPITATPAFEISPHELVGGNRLKSLVHPFRLEIRVELKSVKKKSVANLFC